MLAPVGAHVSGPPNGSRPTTSSASPGAMPALGQVAQHLGIESDTRVKRPRSPGVEVGEGARGLLVDLAVGGGDRVAVRVVRGVAELGRDQLGELGRDRVLEHLGLLVHAVPRHPERLGQVELEQPVVAEHLERHALARAR